MANSPSGPADIVNRAAVLIGGFNNQAPVTGIPPAFDSTALGIAAGVAYGGVVQTVGKQFGWDFARNIVALTPTGNAPPWGWSNEYAYPSNGIEIRQVLQSDAAEIASDWNNPAPTRWQVANNSVGGIVTKVIWCNLASANAVISNQPQESLWDPLFVEAVVRLLASELAMGVAGRPESGQLEIDRAQAALGVGKTREG